VDIAVGEKLPVMFYIPGGGFVGGSSNLYRLDWMTSKGRVIVVSINYRLGVFGFMPHPAFAVDGYNGNYGLEDQREAMRWVQRNIAAFGGDPRRVTVAGESAGAGSVCMHIASPDLVSGLFHQAIIQSAGCLQALKPIAEADAVGQAVAADVGCDVGDNAAILDCMRGKSVMELLTAQGKYTEEHPEDLLPFAPVAGDADHPNRIVPRSFQEAIDTDMITNVPLLYGGTRDEVRLYVGYFWQAAQAGHGPPINANTFADIWLPMLYPGTAPGGGTFAQAIATEYTPQGGFTQPTDVPETLGTLMSDFIPSALINNCLYLHTADALSKRSGAAPIYEWEFADENAPVLGIGIAEPYPDFKMGVVHSSELNYLFPNFSNNSKIDAPNLPPSSQGLADQMIAYWASFIRSGDPTNPSLPPWPPFTGGASVMLLAPGLLNTYDASAQHRCSFWESLYPDRLK
jgi:para-nitrobenzyl esterase